MLKERDFELQHEGEEQLEQFRLQPAEYFRCQHRIATLNRARMEPTKVEATQMGKPERAKAQAALESIPRRNSSC
jgi:hypothetical protein